MKQDRIQASEEKRKAMKQERRQKEGEVIHEIKRSKKSYKKSNDISPTAISVNRARDWYSK